MAPTRTKTVKNKHAANKAGIKGSKLAKSQQSDGVVKSKRGKGRTQSTPLAGRTKASDLLRKRKKRIYTEKELEIPKLNMITPVGVQKPKGKKKGKVFADDPVFLCCSEHGKAALLISWVGKHDYHSCHSPGGQGRANRVQDDQGTTDGGDS